MPRRTRPLFPHVDLSVPGSIETAIEARAFKNEIIVSCFDNRAVRWMFHYARMLQVGRRARAVQ